MKKLTFICAAPTVLGFILQLTRFVFQGLKPIHFGPLTARLKSCPDTCLLQPEKSINLLDPQGFVLRRAAFLMTHLVADAWPQRSRSLIPLTLGKPRLRGVRDGVMLLEALGKLQYRVGK